ncbi:MAG: glycosyltransferase family 2 protein [Faecalimonas sp.]|nr:glycosyltransferase family 2 protein [Faecalimonas sp.]
MQKKYIAVLLSTYNGEEYLREQLSSVLNQETEHQVDIYIRDDGSTDGTVEILRRYERVHLGTIHVIYGENIGYIESFFALIREVEGYDYYALCDQDDIWLEDKLETAIVQCEATEQSGPLLYASSSYLLSDAMKLVGETQKNCKGITWENVLIQNIFPGHTQVFNDALCQVLKEDIVCSNIYVHDFWILYMAMLYGKTIFDNESHTFYRQHGTNTVGFGKNRIEWIVERLRRIRHSDNRKIAAQIAYFYDRHKLDMDTPLREMVEDFLYSQDTFAKRFAYVCRTKLYRQKSFETVLFKLLYLMGGYRTV